MFFFQCILYVFSLISFLKYFKLKPSYLASQMPINPSKVVFFYHKTHTEHTPYTYTPTKHDFRTISGTLFFLNHGVRKTRNL